jgi:RNA polymerase sigma factor (sigma-70 family)
MTASASNAIAVTKVLGGLTRDERGRLLSILIGKVRDFQLAEDVLQDAMVSAVSHWGRNGLPASPQAWLLKVAHRKAIDRIRRKQTVDRAETDLSMMMAEVSGLEENDDIPDERLRLIFTCCHPVLETKSQMALTLRTLGGLTTGEIARAFLDRESTMGQRLSRAKAKLGGAGISYEVPGPEQWAERLDAVLGVVYLIFTTGLSAPEDDQRGLAHEAIFLCNILNKLRPGDPEIEGCLALLTLNYARRGARFDGEGARVAFLDQDRALWKSSELQDGISLVETALARRKLGPYQIKAAIAACHCEGASPDWAQILLLYDELLVFEPTDVVRLNRAVALAEIGALHEALDLIAALEPDLSDYQPLYAAKAELLYRAGNLDKAHSAYAKAIALAQAKADRLFLEHRARRCVRQRS